MRKSISFGIALLLASCSVGGSVTQGTSSGIGEGNLVVESENISKGEVNVREIGAGGGWYSASASTNPGYRFRGWYSDGKLVSVDNPYSFHVPTSGCSLLARFYSVASEAEEAKHHACFDAEPAIDFSSKTATYGYYPQTRVRDETIVSSLESLTVIDGNGWLYFDGNYYARIFTASISTGPSGTFFDGDKIASFSEYYFKCEPIAWKVLSSSNGECSLLSEVLLDAHRYDGYDSGFSTDWANSEIREWLNSDFYGAAFSLGDSFVRTVTVDDSDSENGGESTMDKVYLLSYEDYKNPDYGFSSDASRQCKSTDWDRANGANCAGGPPSYCGGYWTRSVEGGSSVQAVSYGGGFVQSSGPTDKSKSVRPAITIKIPNE